jgi:hypothetical protein
MTLPARHLSADDEQNTFARLVVHTTRRMPKMKQSCQRHKGPIWSRKIWTAMAGDDR